MSIADDLKSFGTPIDNVRWLDDARWDNIDYRDLIDGISLERGGPKTIKPRAVVEANNEPLLYVIPANVIPRDPESLTDAITKLRVKLSTRARGAYVALSEPGKLTLYSVGLGPRLPPPVTRVVGNAGSALLFSELADGMNEDIGSGAMQRAADNTAFHDKLFALLTETSKRLLELDRLNGRIDDVVSLVGRALFARFLIDRGILRDTRYPALDCFANIPNAAATCEWMDEVFNGDLLRLSSENYTSFFRRLGAQSEAFALLTDIVRGGRQAEFPMWGDVDFSHVPVGLLSEVYEQLARFHASAHAKAESIHYTPRNIAAYMVDQAFLGLPESERATAKCLDPAAGGGVFLVLCYRRLVAERWKVDGKRPNRTTLRNIIYDQIRGFDINVSALKLAALSLYLSAIELDPEPGEAGNRKFKEMLGQVLIHVRARDEPHPNSFVLGSLGPMVSAKHDRQYKIVISNPPWTAWPRREAGDRVDLLNERATGIARRVAARRAAVCNADQRQLLEAVAAGYTNPDATPDLAFAWRAMEWAVQGGVIALALHARLLFQAADGECSPRNALFSAMRVTGILNGAALRKRLVWPNMTAQWCLLFGLNEIPADHQRMYYLSPQLDPALNAKGRMRIDYHGAEPIELGVLREKHYLLKTLFRGTYLDSNILDRVLARATALKAYLEHHSLEHGDGYQAALKTTSGSLKDSRELIGLPNLTPKTWNGGRTVNIDALPAFNHKKVRRPKSRELFRGPLLIVPESIPPDRTARGAIVVERDVAFNESYYGYSGAGFEAAKPIEFIRYLHVLCYSALLYHFTLMISAKFGIEREVINKADLDAFPVVPYETLSKEDRLLAQIFSKRIEKGQANFMEIDQWVGRIYGLGERDVDALRDALETAMPFTDSQAQALRRTTEHDRFIFVDALRTLLPPLFELIERTIHVTLLPTLTSTWKFISVSERADLPEHWQDRWIEKLADDEGASALFLQLDGHLIVGLRDQYRYWTRTRARLIAHEIVNKHSDAMLTIP